MQAAVVALVSLLFTSLTLTAVLTVAWRCFGRPRHALLWAAMFGIRSIEWACNLAGRLRYGTEWHWYIVVLDLLAVGSAWLLAAGFVERAAASRRKLVPLALFGIAAAFIAAYGLAIQSDALSRTPVFAYSALCVAVALRQIWRAEFAPGAAETLAAAMLLIVAAYLAGGAVMAVSLPSGDALASLDVFRMLLLLGMPASSILLGSACIFLIASDLAQQMRTLALSDPLTGVFNRRGIALAAEPLVAMCRRQRQPVAVVIADLDRFKQVNDRFGHATGDALLKAFSDHAGQTLRRGDLFGRIGGEEFAFVLPNTTVARAKSAMERLREGIAGLESQLAPLTLSASFGVATLEGEDLGIEDALGRADRALYAAKEAGRNRVVVAERVVPTAPAPDTVLS